MNSPERKTPLPRARPTPTPVSACIDSFSFSRPFVEVPYRFLLKLLFVNSSLVMFRLLLRRDAARLLDVSNEGRPRPPVCRPRPDILVID